MRRGTQWVCVGAVCWASRGPVGTATHEPVQPPRHIERTSELRRGARCGSDYYCRAVAPSARETSRRTRTANPPWSTSTGSCPAGRLQTERAVETYRDTRRSYGGWPAAVEVSGP